MLGSVYSQVYPYSSIDVTDDIGCLDQSLLESE